MNLDRTSRVTLSICTVVLLACLITIVHHYAIHASVPAPCQRVHCIHT